MHSDSFANSEVLEHFFCAQVLANNKLSGLLLNLDKIAKEVVQQHLLVILWTTVTQSVHEIYQASLYFGFTLQSIFSLSDDLTLKLEHSPLRKPNIYDG